MVSKPDQKTGENKGHVAIVGAGIVGVSTAIWLQRAGFSVSVFDPKGPAGGTSFGNAGVLAASSIVPVTVPGLWKKVPGMLLDRDSPLFLKWAQLPRLAPFLLSYMRHCEPQRSAAISQSLSMLLSDTYDEHASLAAGTGAERYLHDGDYVFGYADRAAYLADKRSWDLRREHGHSFEEMDHAKFRAYDPAMAAIFGFGVRCPNHGRISDPGAYVGLLAQHVENQGGMFFDQEVVDIQRLEHGARCVTGGNESHVFDHVVLATGIWSGPLAKKLGSDVPMEAERGYHIEFVNPSIMPKVPTMVASGKFVLTPMEGRLRCAGLAEFASITAKPSRKPFQLLKRQVVKMLPDLTYDRIDEWMGMRPSTTDSLPVIGPIEAPVSSQAERSASIWAGFGHQHIGLTAGPKTGRWLAQLISGDRPNVDLSAFSTKRFS